MLFPLANGDLYHFLRGSASPTLTRRFAGWLIEQTGGLCDAIRYLHDYELPVSASSNGLPSTRRIGFHHDLKPANILLYGADVDNTVLKIGDFGSGAVKFVSSIQEDSIYNRKASTGDPIYSAPEYVIEGRVSLPKDIWGLGCIFLEILVWALDSSQNVIERFEQARREFSENSPRKAPTYWCHGQDGQPYLNPAVLVQLNELDTRSKDTGFFRPILDMIRQMLTVSHLFRPTAAQLCEQFQKMI
jgi:serine/threonine protein kinase